MNTEKLDVKKGIERLARVYCWPNDPTIADKDKYEFKALCEFALFKQFVMIPFFKSLLKYLFKHIARLYQYVASLHIENAHMLTYNEAYLFMRDLEVDKVKLILEQVSCPSNVYNGIIRSLEEENYNLFFSALDKSDHTKMMQVLWMMRYILLGEKGNWDNIDPATPHLTVLPYLSRWITMHDYYYRPYFEIHEYDGEDIFIDERVIEIVDGRLRKKKRTAKNPSPINNRSDNFEEDNKKELDRLFEKSLFKSQWKDLLAEYSDNGNLPLGKSRVNRTYIEDLAKTILTRNVILHKDNAMEKYGIELSEIYNQFQNEKEYNYEEDVKDLGMYILYYSGEMQNVYNLVKDYLPEQNRSSIKQLLDRCPRRDDEPDAIDDISTKDHKEHKQYVKVRDSKIKGSTSKEKEDNLKTSLENLYEVLVNEDNPYIRSNTEKELLIYRFSGYGNPKRPLKTIEWLKSNVLLGHLVRCLISDKSNPPENMGIIATFFQSSSGNSINLATAKHIRVSNFDKEKNDIDQNFVEAVEILRRCGFINAEYTSKRR